MSHPSTTVPRPPKWFLVLAVLAVVLAGWLFLRSYTNTAVTQCQALYRSAKTAADTARVDTTITPGSRAQQEPHSCGFMRSSARWQ